MARHKDAPRADLSKSRDRYALYQDAVQDPAHEAYFLGRAFKDTFGRPARSLREDFCGTGAVCAAWVKEDAANTALGVDLDPEPLTWGRRHNLAGLSDVERARVELRQGDARELADTGVDVVAAQNYSYFLFTSRSGLKEYLEAALANLAPQGVLVMDMMGGPAFQAEGTQQVRRKRGYTYLWEQERFDPVTHACTFHISFKFPDGSLMPHAFTYHWRMWTLPELSDLLLEAGFSRVQVYLEEENGDGSMGFNRRQHGPAAEAWLAYVVGIKDVGGV